MEKQEVIDQAFIILEASHQTFSVQDEVNMPLLLKVVDFIWDKEPNQNAIHISVDHYRRLFRGEWKFPEAKREQRRAASAHGTGFFRNWSRNW